jgi:hypothetical protein
MQRNDIAFRKWDLLVNVLLIAAVLFMLVRITWAA